MSVLLPCFCRLQKDREGLSHGPPRPGAQGGSRRSPDEGGELLEAPGAPGKLESRREHRCGSSESLVDVEVNPIAHHVEAGPRHLVGHSLSGNHRMGIVKLALVVGLDAIVEAGREVGRLDKGPGEVLVAVLGVAFAPGLVVADPGAGDATAVRSVVARSGEPTDVPCLQEEGQRQHFANARRAEQVAVFGAFACLCQHRLLEPRDLLAERAYHHPVGVNGQRHLRLLEYPLDVFR